VYVSFVLDLRAHAVKRSTDDDDDDDDDADVHTCLDTTKCLPFYFKCRMTFICVPGDQVCDGYDQCGDKSDEIGCRESTLDLLSAVALPVHVDVPANLVVNQSAGQGRF